MILPMVSRRKLLLALNILKDGPDLEAITKKAMVDFELAEWKKDSDHITTSFYASQFPGSEKSCKRKMLYSLMNIPEVDPLSPKLRGMTHMGNAAEYLIVHRLMKAGKTLAVEPPEHFGDKIEQTKFSDSETWLSGATDLILDLREEGYGNVLPVDIKSKDHSVIEQMNIGARGYDEKHFYQVQAYIYFCRKFHEDMGWDKIGLGMADSGMLYYVSRQDPTYVKQFFFPMDEEAIARAVETMKETKDLFFSGDIPERDPSWKWTEEPCKWCPFKREACKKDWKDGVTRLSESNGIEFAKYVNPSYDYDEIKLKIEERWNGIKDS
jgi:hypothetical protein